MAKKTTTSFNIDNSINRITKHSVFNRIVKEIDAKEIPPRYIDQILVQYQNGNVLELKGGDIVHPVRNDAPWETLDGPHKKMKDVRIFINTDILEKDVNELVESFLGRHC